MNDTVLRITGIRVTETIPDTFFQLADEIKLLDLPFEELHKRLKDGKVYTKYMAENAVKNFFKPGNLLALREMSLRLVAGNVDEKMLQYMKAHAIAGPWSATERILVGVLASPYAEQLVRSAFRLASEMDAEWIALYVETVKHRSCCNYWFFIRFSFTGYPWPDQLTFLNASTCCDHRHFPGAWPVYLCSGLKRSHF